MQEDDLKRYYLEGFIPGPDESFQSFEMRVKASKEILKTPKEISEKLKVPLERFTVEDKTLLTFTSDKKLFFYHGAMTLICSFDNGVVIPVIQLPQKRRWFSFVSRKELIAHEKIHALRCKFNEKRFEEIIAYRTSSYKYRRFLGPLFSSQYEPLIVLSLLFLGFFYFPIFVIFFSYVTLLFLRLLIRQLICYKALKELKKQTKNPEKALVFLTDFEIEEIGKGRFSSLAKTDIRWKQWKSIDRTESSKL